ncbi:EamA family transporter [Phenylobacterium sp.]|uniref:EamA family transporter n=1 Tax=Phenylobacterium sp. TaxID=1871053 RepID=UPI002F93997D
MKFALGHLPPLTLAALRFTFALLPAVLFLKRPAAWGALAAYGLLIGVGQFGTIYIAMDGWISPGLASLVVQVQAFFTIGLSMLLTGERVRGYQIAALALAAAGLGWLMLHTNSEVTPLGLILVLTAALGWAGGNIVSRRVGQVNMVAFVVWSSLFAAPALFALAFFMEGPAAITAGIRQADAATWAAVLWQSVGNSLFGYAAWAWLLARHPAATISPLSLLVPVFGMGASAIFLREALTSWKLTAAVLVLSGLAINSLWPMLERRRAAALAE